MISVLLPSNDILSLQVADVPTVIALKLHVQKLNGTPYSLQKVHQIDGPSWDLFQNDTLIPAQSYTISFNSRKFELWECPFNDRHMGCNVYEGYEWGTDSVFLKDMAMYCISRGFICIYDFLLYLRGKPCDSRAACVLSKRPGLSTFNSREGWVFRSIADDHLMLKCWWLMDSATTCWHCPYTNRFVLFVPFSKNLKLLPAYERSFYFSIIDAISINALDVHPISLTTPFSVLDYSDELKQAVLMWMRASFGKEPQFEMQPERDIYLCRVLGKCHLNHRSTAKMIEFLVQHTARKQQTKTRRGFRI